MNNQVGNITYEQTAAMLACIGDGIIGMDIHSKISYMNASAEELIGWSCSDAIGKVFDDVFCLINTATEEILKSPIERVLKTGKAIGLQNHSAIHTKSNEIKYISANYSPILQNNIVTGVIVVFRDITHLKIMEETIRTERNNLKTIFEASPNGKLILDKNFSIKQINRAYLKKLNKESNEVVGKVFGTGTNCPNLNNRDCGSGIECNYCEIRSYSGQVFKTRLSFNGIITNHVSYKNGLQVRTWNKLDFIPIEIEDTLFVMVINEDITIQKENEIALKNISDFYLKLYENFPTFFWRFDVNGNMIYMSNNWIELTGDPVEECYDDRWKNYLHPDDREMRFDSFKSAFTSQKPFDTEFRIRNGVGEYRWAQVYNRPFFNMKGQFDGYIGMGIDIHEKKLAEEGLKRYQLLSQNSRDIIMFLDEDGSIIEANEAAVMAYGYSHDEFLNLSIYDIRKVKTRTDKQLHKAKTSGIIFETIHYRKDGTSFPVEVSAQGTILSGKQIVLSIVRDMTERKIAEKNRYESEKKFKMLFNKASDLIYLHEIVDDKNFVSKIIEVNNNACNTLGYKRRELIGKSILKINNQESKEAKKYIYQKVVENGNYTYEATHLTKDGQELPVEINAHYFKMDKKILILSVARDIAERKKAERELQKSEERYHSLFMNLHSGFAYHKVIFDENGDINDFEYLLYNDAYRDMFLKGKDDAVGKRYTEMFQNSEEIFQDKKEIYNDILKEGKSVFIDEAYLSTTNKWYSIALYSPEKGNIAIVITDIDEKKRSDILLNKAKDQAENASRAKSEFLANMSHEIRTPINGIVGMIDLTLLSDLNIEQKENLITAKTCAGSLINIINDILDFSKMEAGKLNINNKSFNMKELLDEITKAHSFRANEKGLELLYTYASNISPYLMGDPNRIQQILNNLINNAIKFTDSGEVSIEVRKNIGQNGKIELQFTVRDTGIGISKEDQKLLFKSFSQVDSSNTRKFGGTGLGLVISKQLLELMEGRIWVESKKDKGSAFYFTLPYNIGNKPGEVTIQKPMKEKAVNHLKILIVEDDSVNQLVLSRMLKDKGYHIDTTSNGLEALNYYERNQYDLILMDIQMPEMDGVEATKLIRAIEKKNQRKHIPIIALTAYALQGDREKYLFLGMDEYVSKPIQMDKLFYAIDKVIFQSKGDGSGTNAKITDNGILLYSEDEMLKTEESYRKVFEQLSNKMDEMKNALNNNSIMELEKYAKIVKELLNQLDADELKSTAFRIELSARKGNIEDVIRYSTQLLREFKLFKKSFI